MCATCPCSGRLDLSPNLPRLHAICKVEVIFFEATGIPSFENFEKERERKKQKLSKFSRNKFSPAKRSLDPGVSMGKDLSHTRTASPAVPAEVETLKALNLISSSILIHSFIPISGYTAIFLWPKHPSNFCPSNWVRLRELGQQVHHDLSLSQTAMHSRWAGGASNKREKLQKTCQTFGSSCQTPQINDPFPKAKRSRPPRPAPRHLPTSQGWDRTCSRPRS